jgi:AraC family transcriptional regulator
MGWVSEQHRVSLQLTPLGRARVQIEGSRPRELATMAALSFTPAGAAIKTVMGEGTAVGILQSLDEYNKLASEMGISGTIDFEPIWSIDDPVLEHLARLVLTEIDNDLADDLIIPALSTAIAVRVAHHFVGTRAKLAEAGRLSATRFSRVVEYIDAHLGDRMSLDAIAAVACLSPFHLARNFKCTTGISPHQFVIRRRIQRGRELVAKSKMNLAEIALVVGFNNQAAFTTRFVREIGISPAAYRRQCQ